MNKGLTFGDIKKYVGILFKKGISFEEFDINKGVIEVGDICTLFYIHALHSSTNLYLFLKP